MERKEVNPLYLFANENISRKDLDDYYQQFMEQAAGVEKPTKQLTEMIEKTKEMLRIYDLREKFKARKK